MLRHAFFVLLAALLLHSCLLAADRPNVVIVITDDQGYGDLSCHGNPILKTPQKRIPEPTRNKAQKIA